MDSFELVIERADRLIDVGRPEEAIEMLTADGRSSMDARAQVVLARATYRLDRNDESIAAAERALAIDPDEVGGWQMLALGRLATGRPVDALPAVQKAVELAPWFSGAHGLAAQVYAELGRFEPATSHAHRTMELDPDGARGWIALTRVHLAQQRWDDAAQSARSALERDPENAEAKVLLSAAQASVPGRRGRELAMETLVETLRDNPDSDGVRRFLIDVALGSSPDRRFWLILIGLTFFVRGLGLLAMLVVWTYTVLSTWGSIPPDVRRLIWADRQGRYRVVVGAVVVAGLWLTLVGFVVWAIASGSIDATGT